MNGSNKIHTALARGASVLHPSEFILALLMPVKIPSTLPARTTLEKENIFIMDEDRAIHQDIRALRVAILNLMPTIAARKLCVSRTSPK